MFVPVPCSFRTWLINSIFFLFLDIRRRIELLQDFEMPIASTNVCVSADKQYIMASGEDLLR